MLKNVFHECCLPVLIKSCVFALIFLYQKTFVIIFISINIGLFANLKYFFRYFFLIIPVIRIKIIIFTLCWSVVQTGRKCCYLSLACHPSNSIVIIYSSYFSGCCKLLIYSVVSVKNFIAFIIVFIGMLKYPESDTVKAVDSMFFSIITFFSLYVKLFLVANSLLG